jgi:hypothetical protein
MKVGALCEMPRAYREDARWASGRLRGVARGSYQDDRFDVARRWVSPVGMDRSPSQVRASPIRITLRLLLPTIYSRAPGR